MSPDRESNPRLRVERRSCLPLRHQSPWETFAIFLVPTLETLLWTYCVHLPASELKIKEDVATFGCQS